MLIFNQLVHVHVVCVSIKILAWSVAGYTKSDFVRYESHQIAEKTYKLDTWNSTHVSSFLAAAT